MKASFILACAVIILLLANGFRPVHLTRKGDPIQDSLELDRQKHINEINLMIKGREDSSAESVYKNLKYIGGFKASLLPLIMNKWSIALGVSCGHCHEIGSWELDTKPEKRIARKMAAMSPVITNYLKSIQEVNHHLQRRWLC